MKEGTKVKVVACTSYHKFQIGEIVEFEVDDGCLVFRSESGENWCMEEGEFEVLKESK